MGRRAGSWSPRATAAQLIRSSCNLVLRSGHSRSPHGYHPTDGRFDCIDSSCDGCPQRVTARLHQPFEHHDDTKSTTPVDDSRLAPAAISQCVTRLNGGSDAIKKTGERFMLLLSRQASTSRLTHTAMCYPVCRRPLPYSLRRCFRGTPWSASRRQLAKSLPGVGKMSAMA